MKNKLANGSRRLSMKKLLIIIFLSTLFIGCSDKKDNQEEQPKKVSNAPIIGDEKQTGKW
jgi:PBP1b-binding outer membrane lipoprotein LpoB